MPLVARIDRQYLRFCFFIMAIQATVGIAGFFLHARADWSGVGPTLFDRVVYGAPIFAPMLFPDLVLLACIGLWVLARRLAQRAKIPA